MNTKVNPKDYYPDFNAEPLCTECMKAALHELEKPAIKMLLSLLPPNNEVQQEVFRQEQC